VLAVLKFKSWTATQWARNTRVGSGEGTLAPSTLNRLMNDPDYPHALSSRTIEALAASAGVEPMVSPMGKPRGLAESDATPFEAEQGSGDDMVDNTVRNLMRVGNGIAPMHISSRALDLAGYLPGDVVIVNLNETARAEDVVCAQVYDWSGGKAETVMRIYSPPYLVSASTDSSFIKPLVVDNDIVVIKGVIVHSMRPRRRPAA
jgi:hypothetical protein